MLTWKLRISVLWIFLAVCQAAGLALLMFEQGVIRGLMAGELWGVNTHSAGVQINAARAAEVTPVTPSRQTQEAARR